MASKLEIWNQAVDLIKAKRIASEGENSLEAQACRLHYPQVVAEMLQGPHDWSFQNRRVVLAATTNDRDHEWTYAYSVPAGMGTPIRVIPDFDAAGVGFPVPLPGEPYAEAWALPSGAFDIPYLIENGILYTNAENATLEYGIDAVEEGVLPPLVVNAIATDLAARICYPVKGSSKRRTELLQEADLFWDRARADDQNRYPRQSGQYVSETEAARAGYLTPLS